MGFGSEQAQGRVTAHNRRYTRLIAIYLEWELPFEGLKWHVCLDVKLCKNVNIIQNLTVAIWFSEMKYKIKVSLTSLIRSSPSWPLLVH